MTEEESDLEDGFCQFCGLEDPQLTEERLDLHYWQSCPMLSSCKQCEQVIEIPTLNEHLMHECEIKGTHEECPRCREPVPLKIYDDHVAKAACNPAVPESQANRCPLCHQDIPPGVEGWKQHLLVDKCPKNERTLNA